MAAASVRAGSHTAVMPGVTGRGNGHISHYRLRDILYRYFSRADTGKRLLTQRTGRHEHIRPADRKTAVSVQCYIAALFFVQHGIGQAAPATKGHTLRILYIR